MLGRLVVLTLTASLCSASLAAAGETLLQSGTRIVGDIARLPATAPDSRIARATEMDRLRPRTAAKGIEAPRSQEQPGSAAQSGMRTRTKVLIFVAAGVGFTAGAYAIDHHVVDNTPSSLGTRKD